MGEVSAMALLHRPASGIMSHRFNCDNVNICAWRHIFVLSTGGRLACSAFQPPSSFTKPVHCAFLDVARTTVGGIITRSRDRDGDRLSFLWQDMVHGTKGEHSRWRSCCVNAVELLR